MGKNDKLEDKRLYNVVKRNDFIQKAKIDLNIQELKILGFCYSKVKPTDTSFGEMEFNVKEYCDVCGIAPSGKNYDDIKSTIKKLRDKSFWVTDESGNDVLFSWVSGAEVSKGSGKIIIRFDKATEKFLLGLSDNYTQYSLLYTLPMKSSYSYRLYELLKSYDGFSNHIFDIDNLKDLLGATFYENFKDFRVNVLEKAVKEINLYTDIETSWEPIKDGKRVAKVKFYIKKRDAWGALVAEEFSQRVITGQVTMKELEDREKEIKKK